MAQAIVLKAAEPKPEKSNGSKKGLGYMWPEVPPARAKRIRELAAKLNRGEHEVANDLLEQALGLVQIQK